MLWEAARLLGTEGTAETLSAWTQDHLADSALVGIPHGFLHISRC